MVLEKYFTLCSIQAHSVAITLHSVITSSKNHLITKLKISSNEEEEESLQIFKKIYYLVLFKIKTLSL